MAAPAAIADFKTKFVRDFPYGTGLDSVTDGDIQGAIDEAVVIFNTSLFNTDDGKLAFLYAAAHFVAVNIQRSGGLTPVVGNDGVNNRSMGIAMSKGVGQVNVSYADVPERIKRMANLLPFWETEYGKKYLMMLQPKLVGNVGVVAGPGPDPFVPTPPVPDAG